jgi:hypothetical protein
MGPRADARAPAPERLMGSASPSPGRRVAPMTAAHKSLPCGTQVRVTTPAARPFSSRIAAPTCGPDHRRFTRRCRARPASGLDLGPGVLPVTVRVSSPRRSADAPEKGDCYLFKRPALGVVLRGCRQFVAGLVILGAADVHPRGAGRCPDAGADRRLCPDARRLCATPSGSRCGPGLQVRHKSQLSQACRAFGNDLRSRHAICAWRSTPTRRR